MKLAALAATIAAASAMVAPPKIEMDDMIETALKRGGTEDVFFHLSKTSTDAAKAHKASLMEANGALPVKKLLRVAIHDHLVEFTEREQRPIMEAAEKAGLKATSFWITNTVFVRGAPVDFIRKVMANKRMDVRKVNGNKEYSVIENVEGATQEEKFQVVDNDTQRRRTQIAEYGIVLTEAERAQLAGFNGEGVTACTVDTGARWTHEALIGSYRGGEGDHDYNWYGPGSSNYPDTPEDGNGHGTHTTGTIAGQPVSVGIGMAPDATWVAAAGCTPLSPSLDCCLLQIISRQNR